MRRQTKILPENDRKVMDANEKASRYLADANEASEQGKQDKAERLYEKCGYWMDRYNRLTGRA